MKVLSPPGMINHM